MQRHSTMIYDIWLPSTNGVLSDLSTCLSFLKVILRIYIYTPTLQFWSTKQNHSLEMNHAPFIQLSLRGCHLLTCFFQCSCQSYRITLFRTTQHYRKYHFMWTNMVACFKEWGGFETEIVLSFWNAIMPLDMKCLLEKRTCTHTHTVFQQIYTAYLFEMKSDYSEEKWPSL